MKDSQTLTVNQSAKKPRACSLEPLLFSIFRPSESIPLLSWSFHCQMDLTSPPLPLGTKIIGASNSQQDGFKSTIIKNHACTIANNKNKSRNHNKVAPLNRDTQPSSDSSARTVLPDNDTPFQKYSIHATEYNIIIAHI